MEVKRVRVRDNFIETPMSISEFNTNAIFKETNAIAILLINLLFMDKGTIPDLPDMGYGIRSRRHMIMRESNIAEENLVINEQVRNYLNTTDIRRVSLHADESGDNLVVEVELSTNEILSITDEGTGDPVLSLESNKNFNG